MVELRIYAVDCESPPEEVYGEAKARLVRALSASTRVKDPQSVGIREDLPALENELVSMLRTPSEDDIAHGVRYVVWPLASVAVLP
jgi:hypothetical protein